MAAQVLVGVQGALHGRGQVGTAGKALILEGDELRLDAVDLELEVVVAAVDDQRRALGGFAEGHAGVGAPCGGLGDAQLVARSPPCGRDPWSGVSEGDVAVGGLAGGSQQGNHVVEVVLQGRTEARLVDLDGTVGAEGAVHRGADADLAEVLELAGDALHRGAGHRAQTAVDVHGRPVADQRTCRFQVGVVVELGVHVLDHVVVVLDEALEPIHETVDVVVHRERDGLIHVGGQQVQGDPVDEPRDGVVAADDLEGIAAAAGGAEVQQGVLGRLDGRALGVHGPVVAGHEGARGEAQGHAAVHGDRVAGSVVGGNGDGAVETLVIGPVDGDFVRADGSARGHDEGEAVVDVSAVVAAAGHGARTGDGSRRDGGHAAEEQVGAAREVGFHADHVFRARLAPGEDELPGRLAVGGLYETRRDAGVGVVHGVHELLQGVLALLKGDL